MSNAIGYTELARAALGFITEDESWPVFVSWVLKGDHSGELHEWLSTNTVDDARRLWLAASPDPFISAAAEHWPPS